MSLQADRLDALAAELEEARTSGVLMELRVPEELPGNPADAYRVQDRAIALGGGEPRAWKLGATSNAAQANFGITEPFTGPVLPGMVLASPAKLDVSGFACTVFEPEITIKLGKDITGPITEDEARAAIASYHPAIEVINFRFKDGRKLDIRGMITDYGANGALVVGDAAPAGAYDYDNLQLEVRINGKVISNRLPAGPETNPVPLLAWFSKHATERGYTLRAGDVITTGSQAGVLPYEPGDLLEVDFGAVGIARIQF